MIGFDRFGFERYGLSIPIEHMYDSSLWAKKMGLSAGLDHSAAALTKIRKFKEGSEFTKLLSRVKRPTGKGELEKIDACDWALLTDAEQLLLGERPIYDADARTLVNKYCRSDVEVMRQSWPAWSDWVKNERDREVITIQINDRGLYFDQELARGLLHSIEANLDREVSKAAKELGLGCDEVHKIVNSPKKLAAVLGLKNAQKRTLEKCTHALARVRREVKSVAKGKFLAGLNRCDPETSILHDVLVAYGAHPGRWTSTGYQAHNLVRPSKRFEKFTNKQVCALALEVIKLAHVADQEEIDLLSRACIRARPGNRLVVKDFKGIEMRMLAWCANDTKALEVIRKGGDSYVIAAADMFHIALDKVSKDQRLLNKVLELACQYGQGGEKFIETALSWGIDLDALGLDAFEAVERWRQRRAPVVRFWKAFAKAFKAAVGGHASKVGPFDVIPAANGRDVAVFDPFGHPVVYRNLRIVAYKDPKTKRIWQQIGYDGRVDHPKQYDIHGRPFDKLYGGLITQNQMESICSGVMKIALIEAERRGLNPVLTVHDEAVCDVPKQSAKEAERELHEICTTVPSEIKGFPLDADGGIQERYQKQ